MNIRGMIAVFLILGIISTPVFAQENEQLEKLHQSIVSLINILTQKGLLTKDAADQLMHEAEQSATKLESAKNSAPALEEFAQNVVITREDEPVRNAVIAPDASAQTRVPAVDISAKAVTATTGAPAPGNVAQSVAPTADVSARSGIAATDASTSGSVAQSGVPAAAIPSQGSVVQSGAAAIDISPQNEVPATNISAQSGVAATNVAAPNVAPAQEQVKPGVVRVPYVPEVVMREIKEEIRQEVMAQAKGERWGDPGALPDWLSRISWDGDFRLRYQRDSFPAGNTPPALYNPTGLNLISNTTDTHNYLRFQARLGMKAKVSDYTYAAFRISTGATTNPVSTNQTLGTGFNKYSVVFDRAFLQSSPYYWLALSGGKMPNPWLSTDLVWDSDVNFEGVAAQLRPKISEEWNGFLTVGAFPFQDIQRSDTVLANSKWLYGTQMGARWMGFDSSTAQFGVALYDFKNVEGTPNTTLGSHFFDNTAAQSMQKGNSLMFVNATGDPAIYGIASKFRELDLTAKMDWATFDPVHVMLSGDYVKNLGFDAAEIAQRTGLAAPEPKIVGYQAVLAVGNPQIKQHGDWQASVAYKYLERDAVLDALTDSDFHLGGTNAKGYIIGAIYGLDKETSFGLRWISTDQIDGPPLSIDTLQVDLNVRF